VAESLSAGVDVGTQSLRVQILDHAGAVVGQGTARLDSRGEAGRHTLLVAATGRHTGPGNRAAGPRGGRNGRGNRRRGRRRASRPHRSPDERARPNGQATPAQLGAPGGGLRPVPGRVARAGLHRRRTGLVRQSPPAIQTTGIASPANRGRGAPELRPSFAPRGDPRWTSFRALPHGSAKPLGARQ
jgi:hypothetical protein